MYTDSKFDIERGKIQKIRLLRENLQSCHSLAPSTLSIALTVKLTRYYVTQSKSTNRALMVERRNSTDIRSRIFFEVVSEGKQVVNVPSEFVCQ